MTLEIAIDVWNWQMIAPVFEAALLPRRPAETSARSRTSARPIKLFMAAPAIGGCVFDGVKIADIRANLARSHTNPILHSDAAGAGPR